MVFLALLIIPLLVAGIGFVVLNGVSWKELLVMVVAEIAIAGISSSIVSCQNETDLEVWNGNIVRKARDWTSCEHSYQCHCREECSGSGKDRSCSQKCDTCYEHSNDWDWNLYTSNAEVITINRVDRQGLSTPARWSLAQVGEPTAVRHRYRNYIKAAPGTLFRHQGLRQKYNSNLPAYPGHVYDYYHLDRLVTVGFQLTSEGSERAWNEELSKLNAELGRAKQANLILVLVRDLPQDYYYALEEAWVGGKKNDVILVVGVNSEMVPSWAEVMAWTTKPLFKIKLRDDIMDEGVLTMESVMQALRTNVDTYFKRKPMADFEYLRASVVPSGTQWTVSVIVGIACAVGMLIFFQIYDPFGDDRPFRSNWGGSRQARLRRRRNKWELVD